MPANKVIPHQETQRTAEYFFLCKCSAAWCGGAGIEVKTVIADE
jgi:hypothetical protein